MHIITDDFEPARITMSLSVSTDDLWAMRYGDGLEIVSPKDIGKEFAEELKKVSGKYLDVKILDN